MRVIEAARAEAQGIYDSKVYDIEKEYEEKANELNTKNTNNLREAKEKHQAALMALNNERNNKEALIKKSFEDKKNELKIIKANQRAIKRH